MSKPGSGRGRVGSKGVSIGTRLKQSDLDYVKNKNYIEDGPREFLAGRILQDALNQMKLDSNAEGFIMRDAKGNPIGAISYYPSKEGGAFSINFLGSDQTVKGTGTTLMKKVAKVAAKKNAGLTLESDFSAAGFYTKLGFSTTNGDVFTMSPSQTKAFAK